MVACRTIGLVPLCPVHLMILSIGGENAQQVHLTEGGKAL